MDKVQVQKLTDKAEVEKLVDKVKMGKSLWIKWE